VGVVQHDLISSGQNSHRSVCAQTNSRSDCRMRAGCSTDAARRRMPSIHVSVCGLARTSGMETAFLQHLRLLRVHMPSWSLYEIASDRHHRCQSELVIPEPTKPGPRS
jgi:hypothetical protein